MILTLLTIVLVLLICFSALFSSAETAFFSLSNLKIRSYKKSSDPRKSAIYRLMEKPRELLVTIMMLNIIANILVQNTVSSIFGTFSSWILTVGVPLGLTLIFGEIIPKSLALPNNVWLTYRLSLIMSKIAYFFGPLRVFLTKITNYISRFIFFFLKKEKEISVPELQHALKASKKVGVLDPDESELIEGYLDLQNSIVKEVMRPREDIIHYNIQDPLDQLVHIFTDQECSRVPVCEGDLENVIGLISVQEFFFHRENAQTIEDLKKILRKPFFLPESSHALSALKVMRNKNEALALVVDEYGSISGLLSQEDLIESVIGEISDRRDIKSRYTRSSEDVIIASGKLELDELEDIFDVDFFSETNSVTIGGWLIEKMGDIPQAGAKYETDEFLFYILAAAPNRIRRVYIRHLKPKGKKSK